MLISIADEDGNALDAKIEVEPGAIIVHSRGGAFGKRNLRNPDYRKALRAILERLGQEGRVPSGIWLDSKVAQRWPQEQRKVLQASELALPVDRLLALIGQRVAEMGRPDSATGHGNSTKRIKIVIPDLSATDLQRLIVTRHSTVKSGPKIRSTRYELVTDELEFTAGFETWRSALLNTAVQHKGCWRLHDQNFVFSTHDHKQGGGIAKNVALGYDQTGENWVVQINERQGAGNANELSAIARDDLGRHLLIRQGRLHKNGLSEAVLEPEFAERTGLAKINIVNGDTRSKKRDWYIVAHLDEPAQSIRSATALFVGMCAAARHVTVKPTDAELMILRQLYAADETGGSYFQAAKGAQPEKVVAKVQGEVWVALAGLIKANGALIRKPCVGGYEADAQIRNMNRDLLVEIKTSILASDIYAGVGQLTLYRNMMPTLSGHKLILLLPRLPKSIIREAVEACEIAICTYDYDCSGIEPQVSFCERFLNLCGFGE